MGSKLELFRSVLSSLDDTNMSDEQFDKLIAEMNKTYNECIGKPMSNGDVRSKLDELLKGTWMGEVVVPENVDTSKVFKGCESLKEVKLPDSITNIDPIDFDVDK